MYHIFSFRILSFVVILESDLIDRRLNDDDDDDDDDGVHVTACGSHCDSCTVAGASKCDENRCHIRFGLTDKSVCERA